MYEAYFGFEHRPFSPVPRADHYFPAESVEAARQALVRCIQRGAGVGMVVGASGTGKSMLCEVLAGQFKPELEVVMLCSGRLSTRRALFQAVLHDLGLPFRGMDEGELRLALIDHLMHTEECPRGMVLLVDEAHTLPLRLFEEIRLITNLVGGGEARVRVVIAGGQALEERLANPKLESFSQRIAARCYLEPFTRTETGEFIRRQIGLAGGRDGLFTDEACTAVYHATGGVPRLIVQVCDHALVTACTRRRDSVAAPCIQEAWADLQQLPAPPTSQSSACGGGGVVEFGTLDDEPHEQPAPPAEPAPFPQPVHQAPVPREEAADPGEAEPDKEPIERLDQIEQALADLDADCETDESSPPEVELVFEETTDPFAEHFDEDELLADPYAGVPAPPPLTCAPAVGRDQAGSPTRGGFEELEAWEPAAAYGYGRDRCVEVHRPAPLQQAEPPDLTEAEPRVAPAAEALPPPDPQAAALGEDLAEEESSPLPRQAAIAEPAAQETQPDEPDQDADDAEADDLDGPKTLPLHRPPSGKASAPRVEDMIVVEDGYDEPRSGEEPPEIQVGRQEYRQLFARLRRG